ncbi:MAG: NYN domain-containing protein [Patescibacteria group bacterium]|jgi:uncharacterized LabA/DUF88 family protein
MQRVQIFIDAGNFYHRALKPLGLKERDFDFEKFSIFLAGERVITSLGKRYYIGTVREDVKNPKTIEAMSRQTQLFTVLQKTGWQIQTSKLRIRTERLTIDTRVKDYKRLLKLGVEKIEFTRSREKGIDVKLATDLIVGAVDNRYDVAIVVSSDTDLVPAIDWVRNRGKKLIEYIGFSIPAIDAAESTKPVPTMIASTDIQRVFVENDLRRFTIKPQATLSL